MHTFTLARLLFSTLLFSTLCLTFPVDTNAEEIDACTPTNYTISNYIYTANPSGTTLTFNFQSHFQDNSIVTDSASVGATCAASSLTLALPNETECSTGRQNLLYDLAGPTGSGTYQIIHTWKCRDGYVKLKEVNIDLIANQ